MGGAGRARHGVRAVRATGATGAAGGLRRRRGAAGGRVADL